MQQPLSPEAYTSVTRRALDIEDYFDILRRHKAWICAPVFAALVLSVVVAFLWPDTYVSQATIRVVPQQVPESYVPSNVNVQLSNRINAMYQSISSRASLTSLITLHNLYQKERQRQPMEDVIEKMKKDIDLGPVRSAQGARGEISAFTLSFKYQNRLVAQKVCAELVSKFMTENTRERTNASIQTTQFLNSEHEKAKAELDTIEEKLASFRQTFQGRLPDEIGQNQAQLSALESRISNLNAALSRLTQQKIIHEADLRTAKSQRASLIAAPSADPVARQKNDTLVQFDKEILALEGTLANLRERYKEAHPDIATVTSRLNNARKQREKLLQEEEQRGAQEAAAVSKIRRFDATFEKEARALDATIERLQAEIKATDVDMESHRKDIQRMTNQVQVVQSRIEAAPLSLQQYAEIVRDREVAKAKYDEMNKKRLDSKTAEELVRRQQGETLDLLDPASLPMTPELPNRPLIIGAGSLLGLMVGLILAGAREAKDTSLKNLKDVRAYAQMTILGSIPLLENDLVVRRRRRLGWLAWSTACLVGIMIMTGAVFYYYATMRG